MNTPIAWHTEFARVIACIKCTTATDRNLLRDAVENVPQPGYVGAGYSKARVLLVGQNPGTPKAREAINRPYIAALCALRDEPTQERYSELAKRLRDIIPQWPITTNYFPRDLSLEDIAYCNVIRCRTANDKKPTEYLADQCVGEHFVRWLRHLAPNVVVFIGKWAWEQGRASVASLSIPCSYINRQRSFSSADRLANRAEITALVCKHRG